MGDIARSGNMQRNITIPASRVSLRDASLCRRKCFLSMNKQSHDRRRKSLPLSPNWGLYFSATEKSDGHVLDCCDNDSYTFQTDTFEIQQCICDHIPSGVPV